MTVSLDILLFFILKFYNNNNNITSNFKLHENYLEISSQKLAYFYRIYPLHGDQKKVTLKKFTTESIPCQMVSGHHQHFSIAYSISLTRIFKLDNHFSDSARTLPPYLREFSHNTSTTYIIGTKRPKRSLRGIYNFQK